MKRILFGLLFVSALTFITGAFATNNDPVTATDLLSDLDVLFQKGQSAAPKNGVAIFMPGGSGTYMTMTVVGHEAPCDFTLFDQAREFSRIQAVNRAPFSYCILGRTSRGTTVKLAIADLNKVPKSNKFVVGGRIAGNMAPVYWDESTKTLVMAGFRISDVANTVKEELAGSAAKILVCGVPVAELSGERPEINSQPGACANLRVMYHAYTLLQKARADLSADKPDKAEAGFGTVNSWLKDNKVESQELIEAKLGEGSARSERKDFLAAVQSYTAARALLKQIDPSWYDMETVIGWRLAKALAAAKQYEAGMREMVRLNRAPSSCQDKCKAGLIDTLDRYIAWAKSHDLIAEGHLLAARKAVLTGEE